MNMFVRAIALAVAIAPGAAFAQSGEGSPLSGPHVGIDGVYDSLEANLPTSTAENTRRGFGGRVHAGYDIVVGDVALLGVEAGVGTGGRTVVQPSLAGGNFSVNPGLTYDVTARAGLALGGRLALYGRGGYRWLRTEQAISGQVANNSERTETERGFTYGGGIEFALTDNIALRGEYNQTRFSGDLRQSKVSVGATIRF